MGGSWRGGRRLIPLAWQHTPPSSESSNAVVISAASEGPHLVCCYHLHQIRRARLQTGHRRKPSRCNLMCGRNVRCLATCASQLGPVEDLVDDPAGQSAHCLPNGPGKLGGQNAQTGSCRTRTIILRYPSYSERHRRCGGTELSLARLRPAKVLSPRLMALRLPGHRSHQPARPDTSTDHENFTRARGIRVASAAAAGR